MELHTLEGLCSDLYSLVDMRQCSTLRQYSQGKQVSAGHLNGTRGGGAG